jgi:dipeptidase D
MAVLAHLEPKSVFHFFENISRIPRGSGNEKAISDYVVAFAKERNLQVYQDEFNNVIIKKNGTLGYENLPTVIIQGHLDMVCEKNMDKIHDFVNDPIDLKIEEDFILANGTTLGADNGIAVAYALALLDSDTISHPPLEVLFTTDEEIGMKGALELDTNQLTGQYFINLDSEEEGELLVSCAGGLKAYIHLPIEFDSSIHTKAFQIMIKGLKGGHSGMEIDKNRANSNKLMGRLLYTLDNQIDFELFDIGGGLKDNAIPREAFASVLLPEEEMGTFIDTLNHIETIFKSEYKTSDPDIQIIIEPMDSVDKIFSSDMKSQIIFLLLNLPNGIQTMSADIEGLVESSLNLGVVQREEEYVNFIIAVRSSVKSLKYHIRDQIKVFADCLNADFIETAEYPEWAYQRQSKLRDLFVKTHEDMYGKRPLIKALHAGLECGVFAEKIPGLDLISLGPDMFDVHTPDEKVSIGSTKRTWEYLIKVMENFKNIETF